MGKNLFNSVKMTAPGKNVFDLSHDVKMTAQMGKLYPTLVMECVPGDSFSIGCESLLRFAPLIAPVMHRIDVTMHYFFVPNRIIYPNWEKWIFNERPDGEELPYFSVVAPAFGVANMKFMDYMGIPPNPGANTSFVSALPMMAYTKIFNEYYRDQNLYPDLQPYLDAVTPGNINAITVDGNTLVTAFCNLKPRAWEHDYFTACLPWAQKGEAVDIPLGTVSLDPDATGTPRFEDATGISGTGALSQTFPGVNYQVEVAGAAGTKQFYNPDGSLTVESTTINDLRRAFRLQEWLEKNARGGTRYAEGVLAHFGVFGGDARLQRPEYITGTKSPVIISEVLNTSGQVDEAGDPVGPPQGSMAGHGVSVTTGQYGRYSCKEHGYIIGIMSVMPKTAYQQGIPRTYQKISDPLDYYWPSFANIGEQGVINQEIYAYTANNGGIFGYIPRYSEYKYMPNRVAGNFRDTLSYWHLGRIFSSAPVLNIDFINCNPRTDIFAVEDPEVDNLYCHVFHKIKAVRPMPKYGNPSF